MFDSLNYEDTETISINEFLIETGVIFLVTILIGYGLNNAIISTEISNITYVAFYVTLLIQLLRAA